MYVCIYVYVHVYIYIFRPKNTHSAYAEYIITAHAE